MSCNTRYAACNALAHVFQQSARDFDRNDASLRDVLLDESADFRLLFVSFCSQELAR